MCRGYKDIKIVFNYYGIRNVGNKLYMNSTIVVKEDIPDPPSVIDSLRVSIEPASLIYLSAVAHHEEVQISREPGHLRGLSLLHHQALL
jgi:hypothetical protein